LQHVAQHFFGQPRVFNSCNILHATEVRIRIKK
jgi:hypothetical protein